MNIVKKLREHIVTLTPAFDRRHADDNKNYGICSVYLIFVVKGAEGAVEFALSTNWHLPHNQAELEASRTGHFFCHPVPDTLAYHSPVPMYDGHQPSELCAYLDGKDCYYSSSTRNAEAVYDVLLHEGSDGVWRYLEQYYNAAFHVSGGTP